MVSFVIRRVLHTIPLLLIISVIVFSVIALPPGDYITTRAAELERAGNRNALQELEGLRPRYGLDKPIYVQYWLWISHFVQGDFGESFAYNMPVRELIGQNMLLTVVISMTTLVLAWIIAVPIGVLSATQQYSLADQFFSAVSFVGLATPSFMLALILMVVSVYVFKSPISGLFSPDMQTQPWSMAKVIDLLKHLWLPVVLVGMGSTASLMRIMRGNLLDILGQQYVLSARGRGLSERVVIWKHAVRMAINPLISILGMQLPGIISGSVIISIVLSLPTSGPLLYRALRNQDMFLAGSFLMLLSFMLIIGNFLADLALAWVDPRIQFE